ncbi:MAG: DNA polymerase III subunit delta' [Deltaproteobacteria bacterium]|nr:DNA polymerase III subunit delta' [Deltaproteobacteria bacterium]
MLLRDIAGQEHAVAMLLRAVDSGRLAHACLFEGPESVGKRSAALGLALALCCTEAPGSGCGACDACRRILCGRHPDVLALTPATSQYLVEQAREVVALAATRPHEAPVRMFILDSADCLNPSAANCLLKTLEEPFPGNHLVLVTAAPDRLLPTIRSRTQRIRFLPLGPAALVRIAERHGASPAQAQTAAALSGGQAARLLQALASDAESSLWAVVGNLRKAAAAKGMGPIFDAAAEFADKESRQDLPEVLALLARLYRDALVNAAGAGDLALLRDRAEDLEAIAERARKDCDLATLRNAVREVVQASHALLSNVNPVTALEKMMMDLRTLEAGVA